MIRHSLARLARMDAAELRWRLKAHGRAAIDRAAAGLVTSTWKRERLAGVLAPLAHLAPVRSALDRRRWPDAHRELARHFTHAPQRFVIVIS